MQAKSFYLLLLVTLLAIPSLCWFGFEATLTAHRRQGLQLHALHLVLQRATEAHLWFEEILSGDSAEDISQVWVALEDAQTQINLLSQGGQSEGNDVPPLAPTQLQTQVPNLQQSLAELQGLARQRQALNGVNAQPGSPVDRQFDAQYRALSRLVQELDQGLTRQFAAERSQLAQLQWLLLGLILLLAGLVVLLVQRVSRQAQALVDFNEKAKGRTRRFLADMAHEIRGPINIIHGSTQLLLMEDLTPATLEKANMILGASSHLTDLLNEVLDFSKIESGKLELREAPFALAEEMKHLVHQCSATYQLRGLELKLNWDQRLPQAVRVDGLRLRQVLLNLISNAWKFTETGGATLEVSLVESRPDAVLINFSLQDTGKGVSKEAAGRIFDAYAQAELETTQKYGGTGLGLDIARRLTILLGGDLQLESEPGQGSRFFFTLALEPTVLEQQSEATPENPLLGKEVLYVEDDPISREMVQAMLGREGLSVTTRPNAEEALCLLEERRFHLILMDILLPGMDGIEATRRIRQWERGQGLDATPIVALSVKSLQADQKAALAAGMDQFLSKPVPKKQLLFAINQALHPA